jgi:hypothetical protein
MAKPRILTANQQGLRFQNLFGELGPERWVTIHHTAGPQDNSTSEACRLNAQYHRDHAAKGWGGIGYHFNVTRGGVILCLRPTLLKGAHVGAWNTGNIGVMFHGTLGHHASDAQIAAFRWLLHNAHTSRMPRAHRTDRSLRVKHGTHRRGHHDWPGHETNACPGTIGETVFKEISR